MMIEPHKVLQFLLMSLLLLPLSVNAAVNYSSSAHGDAANGVLRSGMTGPYVQGNCAHCHEQHASIDGSEPDPSGGPDLAMLLAKGFNDSVTLNPYKQTDSACFQCHATTGSIQSWGISNDYYSVNFGGWTAQSVGINEAFNQASYHNLYDVQRYITGQTDASLEFSPFRNGTNPCSGCHNVHLAKANKSNPGDPTFTAISRPTDHDNLWGDGDGEKMVDFAGTYQAPYYYASTATFEPDGSATTDGSNLPDMSTFCSDCHNPTSIIDSTTLARNLEPVDWDSEMHGQGAATNVSQREMLAPFVDTKLGSYALACTDCHEPHGSPNIYLIRKTVNNGVVSVDTEADFRAFCHNCHDRVSGIHHQIAGDNPDLPQGGCTIECHYFGGFFDTVYDCARCHYHGSNQFKARDGSVLKIWEHKLF